MTQEIVFRVTPEQQLEIKKCYERTDGEISQDIVALREWLKKQPHLPQTYDDVFLEMMLQRNKFSLEKTKGKLDTYFSVRNLLPEFFEDRHILTDRMQHYLKHVTVLPMPNLMKDHSRLYIIAANTPDPDLFDVTSHIKFFFALCDLRMYYDRADSETILVDCENLKFGHVLKFTPTLTKQVYTVLAKAYSDRIKGMHFLNVNSYVVSLITLLQSLLNDKLASRVKTHKSLEALHEYVAKEDLPSDYQGTQKSFADHFAEWKKFAESKNDWLVKQAEMKSNEKLRIGKFLEDDMFGSIHGSFRTLNVD